MGRLTKTRLKPPFLLPMGALALQRGCQEAALQGGLCWAQQGFPRWRGPCNLLAQKESALCNQWGAKVIIREPSKEGASEPALPCILPPPPTMIAPGRPGCAPREGWLQVVICRKEAQTAHAAQAQAAARLAAHPSKINDEQAAFAQEQRALELRAAEGAASKGLPTHAHPAHPGLPWLAFEVFQCDQVQAREAAACEEEQRKLDLRVRGGIEGDPEILPGEQCQPRP